MQWLIGSLVLASVGAVLRRILHMDSPKGPRVRGLVPLSPEVHPIYHPVAQEIETHATILGITLNDAFGEWRANRCEMAWHVVRLAVGEWERLMGLVVSLLNTLARQLPSTDVVVPVRRVAADNFRSREVRDSVGLYEFLDQVLFSSKRRFALKLRLLYRTSTLLTKEFRRTCREGELALEASPEVWDRLDLYFHDFDLIAKETLLAFRTLLACQSPAGLQEMAADLQALLDRAARASILSGPR